MADCLQGKKAPRLKLQSVNSIGPTVSHSMKTTSSKTSAWSTALRKLTAQSLLKPEECQQHNKCNFSQHKVPKTQTNIGTQVSDCMCMVKKKQKLNEK